MVASHLGIKLLPMPLSTDSEGSQVDKSGVKDVVEGLPPDLALRLSSKTKAITPDPSNWFLLLIPDDVISDYEPTFVDCKRGILLDKLDMISMFPALGKLSLGEWKQQSTLRTWQGLAHLIIQAHKRRGESDYVAHWIYIALGLDPLASEWERALSATEI